MVEAWEIRGWSLKVQEEPLSTGSSQNESCYLILLSTLLRFIRQLFDALQYATNRARIVCRRRSLFSALDIPSCRHSPSLPQSLPLSLRHIYIRQHVHAYLYFRVYTILPLSRDRLLSQIFYLQLFYRYYCHSCVYR